MSPDNKHQPNAAHARRMQTLQDEQAQTRRVAKKLARGLVLVHSGAGKGKSSAAFGVIARALGWGHKVGVIQFIKGDWLTGEQQFFARFPDQLVWQTMGEGFTWDTQDKARDKAVATTALNAAAQMLASDDHDLVVLDEINLALNFAYLETEEVLQALAARANNTSVILTGRDAPQALIDYADTVTEMREIKHAYQAGILARKGLDY